jgi:hypothetical protein
VRVPAAWAESSQPAAVEGSADGAEESDGAALVDGLGSVLGDWMHPADMAATTRLTTAPNRRLFLTVPGCCAACTTASMGLDK